LKKSVSVFAILAVTLALLFLISPIIMSAKAEGNYTIDHVDHTISVMYNGYILVNDTITLTGSAPNDFIIGFPQKYGSNILRCTAYSGSTKLPTTLNVPVENRVGFYGAKIQFPNGMPETFSVYFVLSSSLLIQDDPNSSRFVLDFPAYPSFTQPVTVCNVSIVLPQEAVFSNGTVPGFSYSQEQLPAFTYEPASLNFTLSADAIQIVDVSDLSREIRTNEFGEIEGADTYEVTNTVSKTVSFFEIALPFNASNAVVEDQFGRKMSDPTQIDPNLNHYYINFTLSIAKGQSTRFTVRYGLPSEFLLREGSNKYSLSLLLFQNVNYYIDQTSVSFIFPEGAQIISVENKNNDLSDVTRSVFQETVTMSKQGVIGMDNVSAQIAYQYNPMWLSFRSTIWVWALAIVGSVVAAVAWKAPKGQPRIYVPTGAVKLDPEHLRSFVDGYEEKQKIQLEMESLESRVQKGRMPRQRYKIRRRILEARLATLSRDLGEFKEKMRVVGGQYSDFMRQLEVAETEIKEAEANVKSVEARHNRGEISLEAYRKLSADYQRRKENAETTIDGVLLRLREETR
jgi:hypothetical protein